MFTADDVLAAFWARVRGGWAKIGPVPRFAAKTLLLLITFLATSSAAAYASGPYQGPGALSWMNVTDTHGMSQWAYQLYLDEGGMFHPGRMIWSFLVEVIWAIYQFIAGLACWLVQFTLGFGWLKLLTSPVQTFSDALHNLFAQAALGPALLTISAVFAVFLMMKGRWTLGIFEITASLVISALATGVLANPVNMVAGPNGALNNARNMGLGVASSLAHNGNTGGDPTQLQTELDGQMVDSFLRIPSQVVNFGQVIDGTSCESSYQNALSSGGDVRGAVKSCNSGAGNVAKNPNAAMLLSTVAVLAGGLVFLLLAALLSVAVLMAAAHALYQALKLIVALVVAMLPGGARGSLWMTLAELLASFLMIVTAVVFLSGYLLLIKDIFTTKGANPMETFFIVDAILVVGVLIWMRTKERIKASADRLAALMARRPGGGAPTALPSRSNLDPYKPHMNRAGRFVGGLALGAGMATGGLAVNAAAKGGKWVAGEIGATPGRMRMGMAMARQSLHEQQQAQAAGERLRDRLGYQGNHSGYLPTRTAPLALGAGPTRAGEPSYAPHGPRPHPGPARRPALGSSMNVGGSPASNSAPDDAPPRVVSGTVVSSTIHDPGTRLRSRLDERRVVPTVPPVTFSHRAGPSRTPQGASS